MECLTVNVALVAPTRQQCGIADYTRALRPWLGTPGTVEVIPFDADTGRVDYRALGHRVNAADVAHVQYEHGFFLQDDDPAGNFDTFMQAVRVPTLITLHCLPLDDPRWVEHLRSSQVGCLVHSRHFETAMQTHRMVGPLVSELLPLPTRIAPTLPDAAFRAAHRLDGRRVLSIFGFIKAHKGYDLALHALGNLPDDVVLLLAGGGQDTRDAETLASLHDHATRLGIADRVRVTGYLTEGEVGAAMQVSDLVLAPFLTTTASASLATALAWERPVLASALPQHLEIFERYGSLALFDHTAPATLAPAIRALLTDMSHRERLGDATRVMRTRCTFEALGHTCRELYATLAGQRRHAAHRDA